MNATAAQRAEMAAALKEVRALAEELKGLAEESAARIRAMDALLVHLKEQIPAFLTLEQVCSSLGITSEQAMFDLFYVPNYGTPDAGDGRIAWKAETVSAWLRDLPKHRDYWIDLPGWRKREYREWFKDAVARGGEAA